MSQVKFINEKKDKKQVFYNKDKILALNKIFKKEPKTP